jgi:hypothetical protein
MAAHARQLELYDRPFVTLREPVLRRLAVLVKPLCAACHAKQARYGFRGEEGLDPPCTLCFECFHAEINRRQEIAARRARRRYAEQWELPLDACRQADLRRRRAQIAARRALAPMPMPKRSVDRASSS